MSKDNNIKTPQLDRRHFIAGAAGVAATGALEIVIPGSALAAGYGKKPITVVVMYGAGGGTDTIMRAIAKEMAAAKGWQAQACQNSCNIQYFHSQ